MLHLLLLLLFLLLLGNPIDNIKTGANVFYIYYKGGARDYAGSTHTKHVHLGEMEVTVEVDMEGGEEVEYTHSIIFH